MANVASNKQKIMLTLDMDIYFRIKTSQINASRMVNEFFKSYFDIKEGNEEIKDYEAMEKEADDLRMKSNMLKVRSVEMKEKAEKEKKEQIDLALRMDRGLKDGGVLDFD